MDEPLLTHFFQLFFTFAAMVLLIFVSVSAPTWDKISFMDVTRGGSMERYGVFGSSADDSTHIGYRIAGADSGTLHSLSYALVLVPIGAALSGLAFLFGLCGAGYHRVGTILMTLFSAVALLVTLVAWVLSMVLFGIARNRLHDRGYGAKFQNAEWIRECLLSSVPLAHLLITFVFQSSARSSRSPLPSALALSAALATTVAVAPSIPRPTNY